MNNSLLKLENPLTVSCRLEYLGDISTIYRFIHRYANDGHVIIIQTILDKANIPITEPLLEMTAESTTIHAIIKDMSDPKLNLHIALDTMRACPINENSMERQYGKGQFFTH